MDNAPNIRARVVTEGANGPTTPEAHAHLHQRGVFVIPDILANAGGVTTSYFEWVQDRYGYFWELDEVNTRLEKKMVEAFDDVLQTSLKYKTDLRTAAYVVAISRVGNVTKLRGHVRVGQRSTVKGEARCQVLGARRSLLGLLGIAVVMLIAWLSGRASRVARVLSALLSGVVTIYCLIYVVALIAESRTNFKLPILALIVIFAGTALGAVYAAFKGLHPSAGP
jgi:uncharacterized membrane protein YuzA (DUF378 family)